MTDGFPMPDTSTPRVDAVIAAVMKRFPGQTAAAQARYFDAVHQELAPFARNLEIESARLSAALDEALAQLEAERARWGQLKPVAWRWKPSALFDDYVVVTQDAAQAAVTRQCGIHVEALAIIPGDSQA